MRHSPGETPIQVFSSQADHLEHHQHMVGSTGSQGKSDPQLWIQEPLWGHGDHVDTTPCVTYNFLASDAAPWRASTVLFVSHSNLACAR